MPGTRAYPSSRSLQSTAMIRLGMSCVPCRIPHFARRSAIKFMVMTNARKAIGSVIAVQRASRVLCILHNVSKAQIEAVVRQRQRTQLMSKGCSTLPVDRRSLLIRHTAVASACWVAKSTVLGIILVVSEESGKTHLDLGASQEEHPCNMTWTNVPHHQPP